MQQQRYNDDVGTDCVQGPHQPAERDFIHDPFDALESLCRVGNVVDQQENSSSNLDHEQRHQHSPEGVPDIDVARQQVLGQVLLQYIPDTEPRIQEIDDLLFHLSPLSNQYLVSFNSNR